MTLDPRSGLLLVPAIVVSCSPGVSESTLERVGAERFGAAFVADAGKEGGSGASEKRVSRWLERIHGELESMDEEGIWGVYTEGGLGASTALCIAPESGAAYTFYGCFGMSDSNYGDIIRVDGRTIFLDLAVDPRENRRWYPADLGCRVMSEEWCVVDWGDRRFMIPSSQMIPFCNDANNRTYLLYPSRYVGEGTEGRWNRPDTPPEVPKEYRSFLLSAPVRASVLRVSEPEVVGKYGLGQPKYRVSASIDVGRSAGLLPGMTLTPHDRRSGIQAEVTSLGDESAEVRLHTSRLNEFPVVGDVFSAGPQD